MDKLARKEEGPYAHESPCNEMLEERIANGSVLTDDERDTIEHNWSFWNGDVDRDTYLDGSAERDVAMLLAEVSRVRSVEARLLLMTRDLYRVLCSDPFNDDLDAIRVVKGLLDAMDASR